MEGRRPHGQPHTQQVTAKKRILIFPQSSILPHSHIFIPFYDFTYSRFHNPPKNIFLPHDTSIAITENTILEVSPFFKIFFTILTIESTTYQYVSMSLRSRSQPHDKIHASILCKTGRTEDNFNSRNMQPYKNGHI
jgi:hypothetical protein